MALVPARLWTSAATSLSSQRRARSSSARPAAPAGRSGTTSRLLPSLEMSVFTFSVVPLPMVIMAMTAATPMTMPSSVRNERSTLRRTEIRGEADGLVKHHAASIASVSDSMWPSRKPMVRCA